MPECATSMYVSKSIERCFAQLLSSILVAMRHLRMMEVTRAGRQRRHSKEEGFLLGGTPTFSACSIARLCFWAFATHAT